MELLSEIQQLLSRLRRRDQIIVPAVDKVILRPFLEDIDYHSLILGSHPVPPVTGYAFDRPITCDPSLVASFLLLRYFEETGRDLRNIDRRSTHLEPLAREGYLLVNLALTAPSKGPYDSHLGEWIPIMKRIFKELTFKRVIAVGRTARRFASRHVNAEVYVWLRADLETDDYKSIFI